MKSVRDACILQANALEIKLSDQIEQLDELIGAERGGEDFFAKTYITQGMHTLVAEGLARLFRNCWNHTWAKTTSLTGRLRCTMRSAFVLIAN
jgi:hypothetical protein